MSMIKRSIDDRLTQIWREVAAGYYPEPEISAGFQKMSDVKVRWQRVPGVKRYIEVSDVFESASDEIITDLAVWMCEISTGHDVVYPESVRTYLDGKTDIIRQNLIDGYKLNDCLSEQRGDFLIIWGDIRHAITRGYAKTVIVPARLANASKETQEYVINRQIAIASIPRDLTMKESQAQILKCIDAHKPSEEIHEELIKYEIYPTDDDF